MEYTLSHGIALGASLLLFYFCHQWSQLRKIPGPFLASLTNIPRTYWVWKRHAHETHISLHRKYGKLVRIGPNMVSVSNALEVDQIYKTRDPLIKSDFYPVILPMSKGKLLPGLFATKDESLHRMLKKPIAGVYSMSNLASFEPLVDSTIKTFLGELRTRFVDPRKSCDWGTWLQYFAFDVVGEITFSTRLGFLESDTDVEGIMNEIWKWFEYVAVVGQIPWVDRLWVKNPFLSRLRPAKWSPMVRFAVKRQEERQEQIAAGKGGYDDRDFLSRFLDAMRKDPSIPPWALTAWTSSNVLAGSDTTAIFLRTMFKNLIDHPESLGNLRRELDDAAADGRLSEIVTWKESRRLPYLEACFKETGRIHPPFGLQLERIVPSGGMELSGQHIPAGTTVGMNAWAVHRDVDVFGADADCWRPERWLDCDELTRSRMERGLLTFGAGHRSCLGKHISYLEIYKLVPTILQKFDIELVNPKSPWKVQNRWFVVQTEFEVWLRNRESRAT
ncbi:cytochrome P450 [Diaporthe sp. PMI_573]|nr:cytochrome P450 [Diaporthaceae sp. PMI_573]